MVDEGQAAVDAAPPAAATASDWDAADATDGPTDAILGADKTCGGASSVDEPAGFEQLPAAVQKMWVHARDADKFREQAGAVVAAYNKAMEAGALQSTAERAAAAVAYTIDPGYREYIMYDKKWKLERRAAAAKLEALAMKARRLVKKARKLVSCLPAAACSATAEEAADFIFGIVLDVRHVRELTVRLDMQALAIPCDFELPYAKEEVHSCLYPSEVYYR